MSDSDEVSSLEGSDHELDDSRDLDSGEEYQPVKKAKKRRHEESEDEEDEDEEEEEDDEEDEDEDEEEEEDNKKKKKHKHKKKRQRRNRPKGSDFILDDVDVDDDDDDEAFADDTEDFGIDPHEREEAEKAIRDHEQKNAHPRRRELFEGMNEHEVEKYLREKYSNDHVGGMAMADVSGFDEITQHSLMPSTKDPNLWIVKCRMGEERLVAMQIMRKFITYQRTEEPLQIRSVVVKEGLKGIIYIEAFKKTHVAQAIDGISALNPFDIKMVAIKEMVETLKVVKDIPHVKAGGYVRLKRTLYKEDLAQVVYVDVAQNKVHLKLVPRIDYTKKRGALRDPEDKKPAFQRFKRRPMPRLFDMDKIKELGGDVSHGDGDYYLFEGGHYRNGFLEKTFPLDAIMTDGVKPSLTELEKFQSSSDDFKKDLENTKIRTSANVFVPGDVVEVIEGELMNLQGVVQSVDGEQVVMLPTHEDLKEPLTISSYELKKFFKPGDHVKVIGGRFQGDTGLIIRVDHNTVILISDISSGEVPVLKKDAQLCADVASGVDSLGQFQYQDLVQLDQRTVGVIVRMERETVEVLDMHGKIQKIKPQAIRSKKDVSNAVALDSEQNTIRVKDMVKVIDGPFAPKHEHDDERQGEIRYVYRSSIFVHCKKITENGGIIVCRPKQLVLVGGSKNDAKNRDFGGFKPGLSSPNPFQSPRIHGNATPAHSVNESLGGRSVRGNQTPRTNGSQTPRVGGFGAPRGGGGGGGFGGGRGGGGGGGGGRFVRRDNTLIGKSIRIMKGPFKGHFGIVKDCTEEMARVELHANCKTINVDRSHVGIAGEGGNTSIQSNMYESFGKTPRQDSRAGAKTPMYATAQTPMYGSQTPMHDNFGGRTPHYDGGRTPAYDGGRTPLHSGSNWDPQVPNTPAHNSNYEYEFDEEVDGSTAGSMNPHTPGFSTSSVDNDFNPMTPGGMYSDYAAPSPYPVNQRAED
ncbi:hypothetical protein QR680_004663 [Steinernema hermaphroditum]|uniref:Transcription elongation factor SPT5 n=1 Tax=Steinernema hermaphroditum TaxID=289476 RepID=A0AA39HRM1_9BILA|nr:hypothetical protein QR680_004663 [Steinernema hermaphroditum]